MAEETPNAQTVYERSLEELRKKMGCTPERLLDSPELLQVLQERLRRRSRAVTAEACVEELKDAISALGDPKHRDALLVALRLDPRYPHHTLTARRKEYNDDLHGSTDPDQRRLRVDSLRTLERRENEAIASVAKWLVAAESTDVVPRTAVSGTPYGPGNFPDDLVTDTVAYTYYLSPSGAITRREVRTWVKALGSQVDPYFTVQTHYRSERRQGLLEIVPMYGCEVVRSSENFPGELLATLKIHKQLSVEDGIYPFGYTVVVNSDVECDPMVDWRPHTDHAKRVEFQVVFDAAVTPRRAWWFRTAVQPTGRVEPDPEEGRHLELLDEGRYLYKIFTGERLAAHLYYGVAWLWRKS